MDAPTDPAGARTRSARRASSFADIGGGAVGLVVDSSGLLAVAMDQRSAAEELDLDVGDQVTLRPDEDSAGNDGLTQTVSIRPR